MKMSHKRKILLFKSCLLVTYQPFVFYTYIFLIHKIHHKISTARNPDKHQPVVCKQDNFLTNGGLSCETALEVTSSLSGSSAAALAFLWPPAPSGAAAAGGPCRAAQLAPPGAPTVPGPCRQRGRPGFPSRDLQRLLCRAGRTMDNEELGGSVRREKRRKQEQFWDTTVRLWSRLRSFLTQRIQLPPRLLEPCPTAVCRAARVPRRTPAPRGQEASGEHHLPRSKYPAAVRSLALAHSSTQKLAYAT